MDKGSLVNNGSGKKKGTMQSELGHVEQELTI